MHHNQVVPAVVHVDAAEVLGGAVGRRLGHLEVHLRGRDEQVEEARRADCDLAALGVDGAALAWFDGEVAVLVLEVGDVVKGNVAAVDVGFAKLALQKKESIWLEEKTAVLLEVK